MDDTRARCPWCGTHEHVERTGARWLCDPCNVVFDGSADEWQRNAERRSRLATSKGATL